MTTKTLDLNNIERKLFWILTASLGLCLALYLYSVLSLTVSVVERDRMSRTLHEMATTAGDLEQEYITLQNKITLAYAHELGFVEVVAKFTSSPNATAPEVTPAKLSMAR